jgi:hypothetical protein
LVVRTKCLALALAPAICAGCSDQKERVSSAVPEQARSALGPEARGAIAIEDATDVCRTISDHAIALHCGTPDRCTVECRQMLAGPGCQGQLTAFLQCAVREPIDHWHCDDALQTPALRDGYCDAQQGELIRCMSSDS